jgi:hypothetical protein
VTGHEGLILSALPRTVQLTEFSQQIRYFVWFLGAGIRTRNKRSCIVHLQYTGYTGLSKSVRKGHGRMSKFETRNRLWVSIILHPGTEGSRSVGHTRRSRLEIWRQLSHRADPASSATVSSICSSTTLVLAMELCTVLRLTSFRRKRIRKVGWGQGKGGNTHFFNLQDFPWSPDTFENRVRHVG